MAATRRKKADLDEVLRVLEGLFGTPIHLEDADDPLLDHLLVGVLGHHLGAEKARAAVQALSEAFLDMNEARGSPLAELMEVLKPHVPAEQLRAVAWDLRMALQDVWDGTHTLDLEPLRGREPEDQRTYLKDLPNTFGGAAALVYQVAIGRDRLALGPRERHLLDRFGLLPRASSPQALRKAMERRIKPAERYRFAWLAGAGSHLGERDQDWDLASPFCQMLDAIRAKEVVDRERRQKQDEIRRKADEKKRLLEEARRKKAEEVARRKQEREDARKRQIAERKAREDERKRAALEKKKAAEAKRKAAEAARKAAAQKKKEAARVAAAKKKEAARKKAAAAKAAAKKKAAAAKKKAASRPAAKKKPGARTGTRAGARKTAARGGRAAEGRRKSPARKK